MMSDLIAALDNALAANSEEVILRRPYGIGTNQRFVAVTVRIKLTGWFPRSSRGGAEISAGITQDFYEFVMSPTQINEAQWPGGTSPRLPPFNIDQRVPRADADQFIIRGRVRAILFVDPVFVNDELVRINGRLEG